MQKWFVTGISGSGRIELLDELKDYCKNTLHKNVIVHDVGQLIHDECLRNGIPIKDKKFLDIDRPLISSLRSSAIKEVKLSILENTNVDIHFIGIHACFRWRNRLIPGISFPDVLQLNPDGFIHVHRNIAQIIETNQRNPIWEKENLPDPESTQNWMIEEEFITEVLAQVTSKPIFVVSHDHNINNLADLWFTKKKKIYLSYPITEIKKDDPELLEQIQGPILNRLEKLFVVFNPLSIQDMSLTYPDAQEVMPELVDKLSLNAKDIIKKRTIERDFQFIDQSDAVVVFYLTNKVSQGVLAEIYYAHRNMKPIYMALTANRSPFIEDTVDVIESDIEKLFIHLEEFAGQLS